MVLEKQKVEHGVEVRSAMKGTGFQPRHHLVKRTTFAMCFSLRELARGHRVEQTRNI